MHDYPQSYTLIQELIGMNEFKAIADRLCEVSKSLKRFRGTKLALPDFLFVSAPGCGVTTHIRMLANLLYDLDLQRFEGERRAFEHYLPYQHSEKRLIGVNDLLARLTDMAGFRSTFCGVLGLDVDDWVAHADDPALEQLLDFAADYHDSLTIVYEVDMRSKDELQPLINRLSGENPLEIVHFPMPTDTELVEYLERFLKRRGYSLTERARSVLTESMEKIRSAKRFDGLQTLDNLADEVVYRFLASGQGDQPCVSEATLDFIDRPGGFLDRLYDGRTDTQKRRIGF